MSRRTKGVLVVSASMSLAAIGTIACGSLGQPDGTAQRPATMCMAAAGSGTDCQSIDIMESMIPLIENNTGIAHVVASNGPDTLLTATITGSTVFQFMTAGCTLNSCDFTAMPKPLEFDLTIKCMGPVIGPQMGQLSVVGGGGSGDIDSAMMSCGSDTNMPTISLSTGTIGRVNTNVNATSPLQPLVVTNNGTAPLTFSISVPALPEWTATSCIIPAVCTVPAHTSSTVDFVFSPTVHGDRDTTVSFTSNAPGMQPTVDLLGTGIGGVLTVTDPGPPFTIPFGTIARNQLAMHQIELTDTGNAPITVNVAVAAPIGPFGVTTSTLTLDPGVPKTFDATCLSMTAGGPFTSSVTLMSPNAYAANANSIGVDCTIAATDIQVTMPLDFGEVRHGPSATLPVTVTNPASSPSAANLTMFGLTMEPSQLTVSMIPSQMIPPNTSVNATLTLEANEDIDVVGSRLSLVVDGQPLEVPVTGKVVTPAAHVSPARLDLGTACIGTMVTGTVTMSNDGSARLTMQLPTLDQGFATQFQSPTGYPAPLLVGSTATLGIVPSPPTAGTVEGTLTWDVDAPNAPFVVQTLLEFIEAGTAVSPGKLVFGAIAVDATTPRQSVTLENCNVDPIHVTLSGIAPTKGELEAWDLLPATGERTLAPHDTMTLTVAFTPKKPGSHVANIVLDVDGEQHLVELDGDGIGSTLDKTSFYACNCSGSGTPAHGWPIVVALAFVVRRRRRRASVPSPSGSS